MAGQIIGARMKALRRQRGLSQDGMARLFGFKGPADRVGHRDGRPPRDGDGTAARRRKAERAAGLFHRSVPAGRRGDCSPGASGTSESLSSPTTSGRPAAGSVHTGR